MGEAWAELRTFTKHLGHLGIIELDGVVLVREGRALEEAK